MEDAMTPEERRKKAERLAGPHIMPCTSCDRDERVTAILAALEDAERAGREFAGYKGFADAAMADWQTAAKACGMRDDEYPLKAVLRVAAEVERIKARVVELENELACQSCKEYRAEVAGRLDKARAEGWKAGAEAMREKAAVYLDGGECCTSLKVPASLRGYAGRIR
jgi:hypothetical protein